MARLRNMSVIGRGFTFRAAIEIALKLKETPYTHRACLNAAICRGMGDSWRQLYVRTPARGVPPLR